MLNKNRFLFSFFTDILKNIKPFWIISILQCPVFLALYPILNAKIVKNLVNSFSSSFEKDLLFFVCLFILCQFLANVSTRMMYLAVYKVWPDLKTYLYLKIYKIISLKNFYVFQNKTDSYIISKVKNIIQFTESILITGKRIVRQIIAIILILFSLLLVDKILFFLLLFLVLLGLFLVKKHLNKIVKSSFDSNESYHQMNSYIGDKIRNAINIIKYGNKNYELSKLSSKFKNESLPMHKIYHMYDLRLRVLVSFFYIIVISILLFVVFQLKRNSLLTAGHIPYILILIITFGDNYYDMIESLQSITFDIGELKSSMKIVENYENIKSQSIITMTKPSVKFSNIYFQYKNGHEIYQDLNLNVEGGSKVGIFGSSGIGKTTLIKLLTKKIKPQFGHVYLDGKDIKNFNYESIYKNISFVSQEETLFLNETIYDNIKYGNLEASKEDIELVSKIVCLDCSNFKSLYDIIDAENRISGGQKRKIMIARALLKNSPVMIFDEATSFLDVETEIKIIDQIIKYYKDTTIIFISHSILNLKNLDKIFVLSNKKILQEGTHEELITQDGLYEKLFNIGLSSM